MAGSYSWLDYSADRRLIAGFERLQRNHSSSPSAPRGLEARALLEHRHMRVRTGPGHKTSGSGASFSHVSNYLMVPDYQVYAVLFKEVGAARVRMQKFRQTIEGVGRDSPLERIVAAIHAAKIDGATAEAEDLTYLLGQRLLDMPRTEQVRAKRRIVGHSLYQLAIGAVQPSLV